MMRNFRPALPALILLLSAVGLSVPASSAQSKGSAKKKPAASNAKPASSKASAANTSAESAAKSTPAKDSKASAAVPKTSTRSGAASSKTGKRSSRSRRQPGQKAPTSDRVIEIQSALAKDGSYNGMADGKWNDETILAMRKFQASHGLNPTGRLDALTLQKLGLGSQTAGVAAPTPPPGSVSRLTSSVIVPTSPAVTARRQ